MDRIMRAVLRLWGSVEDGRLHASPKFNAELAALTTKKLDVHVPSVSKWSYGEQVEHLYLASHWVFDRLDESMTHANADEHMNLLGVGMLVGRRIPRGVFATIPVLVPEGGTLAQILPLKERLQKRLDAVDWDMVRVKASPGRSKHPRMHFLTSSHWMVFLDIHHRHHLRIIRDIEKKAAA
jgi:hypothetical protein